jgi:hypothetical protein
MPSAQQRFIKNMSSNVKTSNLGASQEQVDIMNQAWSDLHPRASAKALVPAFRKLTVSA